MVKTIRSGSELQKEFISYGRGNTFSNLGYDVLFAYLEELEQCSDEPYELDVIELCGLFTEYETVQEALEDYGMESLEELEEETTVLEITNYKDELVSIIVEVF